MDTSGPCQALWSDGYDCRPYKRWCHTESARLRRCKSRLARRSWREQYDRQRQANHAKRAGSSRRVQVQRALESLARHTEPNLTTQYTKWFQTRSHLARCNAVLHRLPPLQLFEHAAQRLTHTQPPPAHGIIQCPAVPTDRPRHRACSTGGYMALPRRLASSHLCRPPHHTTRLTRTIIGPLSRRFHPLPLCWAHAIRGGRKRGGGRRASWRHTTVRQQLRGRF